jgi:hypothetical protein
VQFAVLAQDRVYKNGNFIRVQGSFGVLLVAELAGRRATVFINMALHDLNPQNLMQSVPATPASVYFVSENSTTSKQYEVRRDTDTVGAVITVFRFMPTLPFILDGLARNKVTIAFSRKLGGMGVLVPIDTSVEQTADDGTRRRSQKAQLEFLNCGERLFPSK